jgi:hypothetical protein
MAGWTAVYTAGFLGVGFLLLGGIGLALRVQVEGTSSWTE